MDANFYWLEGSTLLRVQFYTAYKWLRIRLKRGKKQKNICVDKCQVVAIHKNMNTIATRSRIITMLGLPKIKHALPKSWTKAAGILSHKRKSLESHLKTVSQEWDRRSSNK